MSFQTCFRMKQFVNGLAGRTLTSSKRRRSRIRGTERRPIAILAISLPLVGHPLDIRDIPLPVQSYGSLKTKE